MGKPLLTDEIIERANRGEKFYDDEFSNDFQATKIMRTDFYDREPYRDDTRVVYEREEEPNYVYKERSKTKRDNLWTTLKNYRSKNQHVYKSRRIENAKRSQFQHKLNVMIFVIVLLLLLLFIAVFYL